jgi:hypothetical protein
MERNPSTGRAGTHADECDGATKRLNGDGDLAGLRHDHSQGAAKGPFESIRRIRSLRRRLETDTDEEALDALRGEVLLLREENAQLRIKMEREPDLGEIVERMRALTTNGRTHAETGDHTWHLLTEAVIVRDTLVDLCRRTREAMTALEGRLLHLEPLEAAANGAHNGDRDGENILLNGTAGVPASNGSAIPPVQPAGFGQPQLANHRPGSANGHVTEDN